MKFCPECGNKLVENAKFCPECGYKLLEDSSSIVQERIESKKVSSETYIKNTLANSGVDNIFVTPDIDEKMLLTACRNIGLNTNPTSVLGIINTAFLSKGKTGALFTGKAVYLKGASNTPIKIPFEEMKDIDYSVERKITDKGKSLEVQFLTVVYQYGNSIQIDSQKFDAGFPFHFLANLLKEFNENVDKIESKNQVFQLSDIGDEIIELYFKLIILYLKSDDGMISSDEYKELITLMTKVKVSKNIANILREYRFSSKNEDTFSSLILDIKEAISKENISSTVVFQSLAIDFLSMSKSKIDDWKNYEYIIDSMNELGMSDRQVNFIVKKIKSEEKIISDRLDDKQVTEMTKDLAADASGVGISVKALAISGALFGLIGITGYGVYKGVKYFSNRGEKSSIRISALLKKVDQLRAANVYIIDDVNWLIEKVALFTNQLKESQNLESELFSELEYYISLSQNVAESGTLIEVDQSNTEREYLIANLPKKLDIEKYEELMEGNVNKLEEDRFIKTIYLPLEASMQSTEQSEIVKIDGLYLDEENSVELLNRAEQILERIGYFDIKSSTTAQSKVAVKKAKSSLKSLFGGE